MGGCTRESLELVEYLRLSMTSSSSVALDSLSLAVSIMGWVVADLVQPVSPDGLVGAMLRWECGELDLATLY